MLFQFFKLNLLTFLFEIPRQVLTLKVFLLSHGVWTWSSNSSWSLVVFVWLLSVPTIITGIKRARTVHEGSNLHLINLWSFGSIRTKHQLGWRELRQSTKEILVCGKKERWGTLTKVSRNDTGIIDCAAYSGFGKPDSQAVHVNFACEYMIYALKKLLL